MTVLKIEGKPSTAAMQAIEPHIQRIYSRPGVRVMAVIELAHIERTQPAPEADKSASVRERSLTTGPDPAMTGVAARGRRDDTTPYP